MASFEAPLVSIIIVTHNSQKYIKECLSAVLSSNYPSLEVIIIENNSTDQTTSVIEEFKNKIVFIKSRENTGYAGGNNLGLKKARGDYVAIINPDTVVDKNWLFPLVELLEDEKNVAAVQPKIILKSNKKLINASGKTTHYLGFDWVSDYKREENKISEIKEITSFSGSAVVIKKDVLDKIGFFDSRYFMYYEDGDLSWRARIAGYKLYLVPSSVVYHDYKYAPQDKGYSKKKFYFLERNRLLNILTNYEAKTLLLLIPMVIFMESGMLLYFFLKKDPLTKIRSYLSIIKALPNIRQKRKFITSIRKKSDKLISRSFADKLNFEELNSPLLLLIANPILSLYWKLVSRFI